MDDQPLRAEILRLLRRNARMSNEQIADRLGRDPDEVAQCIRTMESDGTIMGYSAVVNEERAGDGRVRAIIEVEVLPERDGGFDRIADLISRFEEVHAAHLVSGRYDLQLEVVGKSLQDVASFVASKLATQDGVRATSTLFILRKYKDAGVRLHEDETYERLKIAP